MERTNKDTGRKINGVKRKDRVNTDRLFDLYFKDVQQDILPLITAMKARVKETRGKLTVEQLEQRVEELEAKNIHLTALIEFLSVPLLDALGQSWETQQRKDLTHYSTELQTEQAKRKRPKARAPNRTNCDASIREANTPSFISWERWKRWHTHSKHYGDGVNKPFIKPVSKDVYYKRRSILFPQP